MKTTQKSPLLDEFFSQKKEFTIVQNFTPRKKKQKNWWEFGTGSQKLNVASKKIAGSTKYLSLRPTWLHALIMTSPGHKIFSPKFQKFWGKKTLSFLKISFPIWDRYPKPFQQKQKQHHSDDDNAHSISLSLNQCCWLGSSGFWGCSERVPRQCWLVLGSALLLTYLLSSYRSKKGCLPYF